MKEEEQQRPLVSVILVNHNTRQDLLDCLDSIKKNVTLAHEVILTDNNSRDGSVESVRREFPSVIINALDDNVGFGRANNIGVKKASGKYLLILNPDTLVLPNAVEKMVSFMEDHSRCGIVAPLVLNSDRSFQLSFGRDLGILSEIFYKYFADRFYHWQFKKRPNRLSGPVHWVSGACFLITRQLFNQLGGFDEEFFIYIEDADLGRRVRQKGYKVCYHMEASIIHRLGKTCTKIPSLIMPRAKESHLYYYLKHHGRFKMEVMRIYLSLRFQAKILGSLLKGDEKSRQIYSKTLKHIREY
jgi:GT2 family glycosyltransferase